MSDPITTIGQLIDASAQRDAIHIAIAPVVAGQALSPSQSVSVNASGEAVADAKNGIGIVDPFLSKDVSERQMFWLFLKPNSVTGMRHHWSHPAFPETETADLSDINKSRVWLQCYAEKMNCYDEPAQAYQRLVDGLKSGDLFAYGSDLHGFFGVDQPEELREHAEKVLGIRINWEGFEFRCSC